MGIKLIKKITEASPKAVNLQIKSGRAYGFPYAMLKALVEKGDVPVYMDDTGPVGEDERIQIISCSPKDAFGRYVYDSSVTPKNTPDLIVVKDEIGQSGRNWASLSEDNEEDHVYVDVEDLPTAISKWHSAGLI